MPEALHIDGRDYEGHAIPTSKANLLMIKNQSGFLGCGYFNIEVADKLEEPVALVTGVKTFEDMLKASVFSVSQAAAAKGIQIGDSGQEALAKLV
jgi:uncharacterized protein YunC (DUF1805 family)